MAIQKYKDANGNWRILLGGGSSSSDITVDSVLSTVSENPVQNKVITNAMVEISDDVDDIKEGYLKSASIDSNALTLVNQDDEEIKFLSSPADIVSTTEDGLVPKIENSNNDSISSPMDDWVLTSNKGSTPTWKRLPSLGDTSEFIQGFHHTTGTASGTRNTNADNDPTVQDRSTNPNRYYGVETDSKGKLFVNVPWERGEAGVAVEYGAGTGLSLENNIFNHTNAIDKNEVYPTGNSASANGGTITVRDIKYDAQGHVTGYQDRDILLSQTTYSNGVGLSLSDDHVFALKKAETNALGGIKIAKDNKNYTITVNTSPSISANVTTAGRYYGVETDKNGKAYVYVPWVQGEAGVAVTYNGGNGITIGENNTINHSNSAITEKTEFGSTANTASANGGTITVTDITHDTYGHITSSSDRTITLSQDHVSTSPTQESGSDTSGSTVAIPYITVNEHGHVINYGTRNHKVTGFTNNLGTVTSISAGVGLRTDQPNNGDIISSGTLKLKTATTDEIGGIKVGSSGTSISNYKSDGTNYYQVNVDSNGKGYVALPEFTNNSTINGKITGGKGLTEETTSDEFTLNVGAGTGISVSDDSVSLNLNSSESIGTIGYNKVYAVGIDINGQVAVKVPWTNTLFKTLTINSGIATTPTTDLVEVVGNTGITASGNDGVNATGTFTAVNVPSKTYIDNINTALSTRIDNLSLSALEYTGIIAGGQTGTYGALTPAATKGNTYFVSSAGKINGKQVEVGDAFVCIADNVAAATSTTYTTVQNSWQILNTNWSVSNKDATLEWNKVVTLASVGGVDITAKLPESPTANTWRNIKVEDVQLLDTDTSSGALNFKATGAASVSGSGNDITIDAVDTTYTFANGTNGFTVTPLGGSAQTVTVTPKITNNVTYTGDITSGKLAVFDGTTGQIKASDYSVNSFGNAIPTTFTWTEGSTAGPTGSLTGTDMSPVQFGAIPSASPTTSGVVTTGTQTFTGQKTFETLIYADYMCPISNTQACGLGTDAWRYHEGYFTELYTKFIYLYPRTCSGTIYLTGLTDLPTGSSTVNSQIYASNYAKITDSNSYNAAIYAPGGFYESSDERLKDILSPVKTNLDDLSKLRKVYFSWKNASKEDIQIGIIAQDLQKLYPELVSKDSDTGLLSVAYDKLSVITLEAIDNLYNEHKRLKDRVDKLEKLLTNKGIL